MKAALLVHVSFVENVFRKYLSRQYWAFNIQSRMYASVRIFVDFLPQTKYGR